MSHYRRNRVPGGTYFFTVNLLERRSCLLVEHIELLREAVRVCKRNTPFHIDAWVVLPEHIHCIWTLPEGDFDYSGRWRAIKKHFQKWFQCLNIAHLYVLSAMNAPFSRDVFGNIRSEMIVIMQRIWIISTSTLLNTDGFLSLKIGRIQAFIVLWRKAYNPLDWTLLSDNDCFRSWRGISLV